MLPKKPYQKPELIIHGNVEQITQVLDNNIDNIFKAEKDKDKKPTGSRKDKK